MCRLAHIFLYDDRHHAEFWPCLDRLILFIGRERAILVFDLPPGKAAALGWMRPFGRSRLPDASNGLAGRAAENDLAHLTRHAAIGLITG